MSLCLAVVNGNSAIIATENRGLTADGTIITTDARKQITLGDNLVIAASGMVDFSDFAFNSCYKLWKTGGDETAAVDRLKQLFDQPKSNLPYTPSCIAVRRLEDGFYLGFGAFGSAWDEAKLTGIPCKVVAFSSAGAVQTWLRNIFPRIFETLNDPIAFCPALSDLFREASAIAPTIGPVPSVTILKRYSQEIINEN